MSYSSVSSHKNMIFDERRNKFYFDALKRVITPDSVVLDLGSGLGIHGMMAAKLGAKAVYMVEPADVITVSEEIAVANGLIEQLHFFKGSIEDVNLPSQVDVITSVFTGNMLLNEDLLPSLFYAREKYLKKDGVLIPEFGELRVVPVTAVDVYENNIGQWSQKNQGLDFSAAQKYVGNTILYKSKEFKGVNFLAEPATVMSLDFFSGKETALDAEAIFNITETGLCHGLIGWFRIREANNWLSTSPKQPGLHWSSAFLPFEPAIRLAKGTEISVRLLRPQFGEWSWFLRTKNEERKHSGHLANPLSPDIISKMSADYLPTLNEKGENIQFILSKADGSSSVRQIAEALNKAYPKKYPIEKAMNFVRELVNNYG